MQCSRASTSTGLPMSLDSLSPMALDLRSLHLKDEIFSVTDSMSTTAMTHMPSMELSEPASPTSPVAFWL
eukprot:g30490.t1